MDWRSGDPLERPAESGGPDARGAADQVRSKRTRAEAGVALDSWRLGGGAVRAGVAGSFARAVYPAGAVSLRCHQPPSVPTPGPAARP